jgi:DNA-directed RNA polymerase
MKRKLLLSLWRRLRDEVPPQSPLIYLTKPDLEDALDMFIEKIYLYTRPRIKNGPTSAVELFCAIGHDYRKRFNLKKSSPLAVKTGAFVTYTFEELGLLRIFGGRGLTGHQTYLVELLDDATVTRLWNSLKKTGGSGKMPSTQKFPDWSTGVREGAHDSARDKLVKTGSTDVLAALSVETHPEVFETVNRAQAVGWRINKKILAIQEWSLRNKTAAFSDIWNQLNPEAKKTKVRETEAIMRLATKFKNDVFYHGYQLDFRGRKYPTTAYLHEQGSDTARGLLLRNDAKKVGEQGFFWLLISIANTWGGTSGRTDGVKTDKLPLNERRLWVLANEEELLSFAEDPKENQGWMKADKPWQFLAALFELLRLRVYQMNNDDYENYDMESRLECYVDG